MGKSPTAAELIAAIPGTGGIISAIARRVGCSWHTAKKYIQEMPTVKAVYEDECESVLDLAEVKLIEAVKGGDLAAVKYMLSTKGKGRGYVERQETVNKNETLEVVTRVVRHAADD